MSDSSTPEFLAEAEPTAQTTPVRTALLMRDNETVWVDAYTQPRMVVSTYPAVPLPEYDRAEMVGVVRERHVGPRADLLDVFDGIVARLVDTGWTVQHGIDRVWAGDPWDATSTLDQPPTF